MHSKPGPRCCTQRHYGVVQVVFFETSFFLSATLEPVGPERESSSQTAHSSVGELLPERWLLRATTTDVSIGLTPVPRRGFSGGA